MSHTGIPVPAIVSILLRHGAEFLWSKRMGGVSRRENGMGRLLTGLLRVRNTGCSNRRCVCGERSRGLISTIPLTRATELTVALIRSSFSDRTKSVRRTTDTAETGSRRLKSRMGKRRRIHGRHPDPSLVDLEKIRDQAVEVDVGVRKVVEGQLFPVPGLVLAHESPPQNTSSTYIWNSASKISIGSLCSSTFC